MAGSCKYNRKEMNFVDLWDTDRPARGSNGTGEYEEAMFHRHLKDIIANHDTDTPLFLYYAPHLVHTPLQVPITYI